MSTTRRYVLSILTLIFILGCSTVPSLAGPTPTPLASGSQDLISYISDKSGSNEIYVMSLDKSYSLQLTDNDLEEEEIHWAPNAQKLLFTACQDRFCDLYLIDAGGDNFEQLTNAEKENTSFSEPAWSPDGKRIAFVATEDGEKQIYIMNADGSRRKQLTEPGTFNTSPVWSPDGSKIAYSSNQFGDYDILVMEIDGKQVTQVTDNDFDDTHPVWSPDSTKIAYLSTPDREKGKILFLVNADGTNAQDISAGVTEVNEDVAWSPGSEAIAFSAFPTRQTHQIYGVWADTWGVTQYSVNDLNNFGPSWAPDGERLVYYVESDDLNSSEVYVNAGGTRNSHQLTFDEATVSYVAWVPIKTSGEDRFEFPTSTPAATATPDSSDVYVFDDFSDSDSGWGTNDTDTVTRAYMDGTYQITIDDDRRMAWTTRSFIYTNVRVEVDTQFDHNEEGELGVFCRFVDKANYYFLRIAYSNDKGYFRIGVQENDENRYLSGDEWVRSDNVHSGSNHISASCIDNRITLSVNGIQLMEVQDDTLTKGKIGLFAGTFDIRPATFTFDNFEAIPTPD